MLIVLLFLFSVILPSLVFAESGPAQACRKAAGYKADGGVDYDKLNAEAAIVFCQEALVANPDDPTVLAYYSRALLKLHRYADAVNAATTSANRGNPAGQRALANMYENGDGLRKDLSEAVRLVRLSANQGYSTAKWDMGRMYAYGIGLRKDLAEAARWYRKSAERGNDAAQLYLGVAYDNGFGVQENLSEAANLYRLSAMQGTP